MQQLRQGIKLKEVNFSKTASEFGMTPYEMLLEDIRYLVSSSFSILSSYIATYFQNLQV